jgi:hypothetical protein
MSGRRARRGILAAAAVVIAALAGTYAVTSTGALEGLARWGNDLTPLEPVPARVVIDGFPVGPPVPCEPLQCQSWEGIGETALDRREPRHPPVVRAHLHQEDLGNRLFVAPGAVTRSLTYVIVVFDLEDGTHRAVAVVCAPNDCESRATYDR